MVRENVNLKVLIIASGRGKRLASLRKNVPKPLVKLLGLTLIERVILLSKECGLRDFLVVVGFEHQKIEEHLAFIERKYNLRIQSVYNPFWDKGNGFSLLQAQPFLREDFILLMSDHLFAPEILKGLILEDFNNYGGILCIDRSKKKWIDYAEATKVRVSGDKIIDIGKDLKEFDAIDTGIFKLSPHIFNALKESISRGDDTLSGGVKVLSKKIGMKVRDIEGRFWIDIDTPTDFKNAQEFLLRSCVKLTDGVISKYLNRPISLRISTFLVNTSISANTVSFISFFLGMFSAILFCAGLYSTNILAGLFAQLSSIIDGCDGEVAKLKYERSSYGAWLDAVLDRYADALIILGICIGYWRLHLNVNIWIAGFWALLGGLMNSYTAIKYDVIFNTTERKPLIRIGRDLRLFIVMVGSFLNKLLWVLIILGIVTNFESLRRLVVFRKYASKEDN